MIKTTHITFASLILALFFIFELGCNSSKNTVVEKHQLLITLADGLQGKYISNAYESYSPGQVSKSSRTINQYRASFECSNKKLENLKSSLSNDENVVAIVKDDSDQDKIQTGTSSQRVKTKPIRDKN